MLKVYVLSYNIKYLKIYILSVFPPLSHKVEPQHFKQYALIELGLM